MMEEANRMIADSANRLGKAAGELRDLVVRHIHRLQSLFTETDSVDNIRSQGKKIPGSPKTRNY